MYNNFIHLIHMSRTQLQNANRAKKKSVLHYVHEIYLPRYNSYVIRSIRIIF